MKTKYTSYIPKLIMVDEFEKIGIFKELTNKNYCPATKCIAYTTIGLLPTDPRYIVNSIFKNAAEYGTNKIQLLKIISKYNLKKYIILDKDKLKQYNIQWNLQAFDIIKLVSYYRAYSSNIEDRMISESFLDKIIYEIDNMTENTNKTFALEFIKRYKYLSIDNSESRNFHMRKNGDVTFLPGGKKCLISDNDKWLHDNRQKMKLGKAIKHLLGTTLRDSQIEDINNRIKSKYTFTNTISVVNGEDILKYYLHTSYAKYENIGTLYDSCMKHESCQEWLQIYADNDDQVSLVISLNTEGKLTGRALLWHKVENGSDNKYTVMDRIYGNEITQEAFKKHALKQGWWHKVRQTYNHNIFVNSLGQTLDRGWVTLANNNDYYPYMDSFKYTDDWSDGHVILDMYDGSYTLDSVNGGPANDENDDDYVYDRNGDRYHVDDTHYDDIRDEYIHVDDAQYCETDETYCYYENAIELECGNYAHPDGSNYCYSEYDGMHYDNDKAFYSEYCEDYFSASDEAECYIHGYVHVDYIKTITIDGVDYDVHEDVTEEEILETL